MNADGHLLAAASAVCAKDVFPISMWQAPDKLEEASVKDAADAGFTVYFDYTHKSPEEQKFILDECLKYGMKSKVDDIRLRREIDWKDPDFAEKTAEYVSEYKDHPARWGYQLVDEPHILSGGCCLRC